MTTDSPWTLGSVTTRRSTWWPSIVRPTRPSCGTRRSAMSRSAMIFTRLTTPETMRSRDRRRLDEHAVDAEAHAHVRALGLEVDVGRALLDRLGDDLVDELDDRRVVGGLAQVDDLGRAVLDVVLARRSWSTATTSSRRVMRLMSVRDVLAAGDRGADLEARHDRDVVDGQDVGGVGHGDEHGALVDVGDRDGLVALGGGGAEEVRGGHVDREAATRSRWSRPWRSATARASWSCVMWPPSSEDLLGRACRGRGPARWPGRARDAGRRSRARRGRRSAHGRCRRGGWAA